MTFFRSCYSSIVFIVFLVSFTVFSSRFVSAGRLYTLYAFFLVFQFCELQMITTTRYDSLRPKKWHLISGYPFLFSVTTFLHYLHFCISIPRCWLRLVRKLLEVFIY